jgi:hypothetical protein
VPQHVLGLGSPAQHRPGWLRRVFESAGSGFDPQAAHRAELRRCRYRASGTPFSILYGCMVGADLELSGFRIPGIGEQVSDARS